MAAFSRDTSPETHRRLIELYRQKTPAEKIAMAADTTACMRTMCEAAIRQQYPAADEREIRCRFAARWLGREWAIRLFQWDPTIRGW